jgi:hypothetical protein
MITGVLCSSNCAVAAVCQLFWLLPCTGFVQDVHSQVHPVPLARPDTRENAGKQPLIWSLNSSVAKLPASCLVVVVTLHAKGFVHHVNTAKYKLIYVYDQTHWNRYAVYAMLCNSQCSVAAVCWLVWYLLYAQG